MGGKVGSSTFWPPGQPLPIARAFIVDRNSGENTIFGCSSCPPTLQTVEIIPDPIEGFPEGDKESFSVIATYSNNYQKNVSGSALLTIYDEVIAELVTGFFRGRRIKFKQIGTTFMSADLTDCRYRPSDAFGGACECVGTIFRTDTALLRGTCNDIRDVIAFEYIDRERILYPICTDFTQTKSSAHFSFSEMNTGDYSWAIIQNRLLTGLESARTSVGDLPIDIESGYRNPARNDAVGGKGGIEAEIPAPSGAGDSGSH